MSVKQTIPYRFGTFFITFTCSHWLPLIEKVNGHDILYKWFDYLKLQGHFINAYAIMPNHVHVIISFRQTKQSISTIIGNGKRFMAYEIVKRLELACEYGMLHYLEEIVGKTRKENNKRHEVWELSFDWKECISEKFINQKLEYIHNNPCSGKWNLSKCPEDYIHSSAKFYETGQQGIYKIDHIGMMADIALHEKFGIDKSDAKKEVRNVPFRRRCWEREKSNAKKEVRNVPFRRRC
jgi:REP element-mobilizing transposase RayT